MVFAEQIRKKLEVYLDDLMVNTSDEKNHCDDLEDIIQFVRRYNMLLNPAKCSYGVQAEKLLRFMLTRRGK